MASYQFFFRPLSPSLREGDLIGYGRPVAEFGWRTSRTGPWQVRKLCRVLGTGYEARPVRRDEYFPGTGLRPARPRAAPPRQHAKTGPPRDPAVHGRRYYTAFTHAHARNAAAKHHLDLTLRGGLVGRQIGPLGFPRFFPKQQIEG